jgi:hypothetical protein
MASDVEQSISNAAENERELGALAAAVDAGGDAEAAQMLVNVEAAGLLGGGGRDGADREARGCQDGADRVGRPRRAARRIERELGK